MDNNFNQGQPMQQQAPIDPFAQGQAYQQPVQNQQMYQQPVQNQMYAQAPNQMYAQAPKQPANFNLFELLSIILSGVGMFMTFLGTILTCACSASKSVEEGISTSAVFILTIFGILIAIGGVVMAIMAVKDTKSNVKAGKIAKIAAVVGVFAIIWGILPTTFICAYNCALESEMEDVKDEYEDKLGNYGDIGSMFE